MRRSAAAAWPPRAGYPAFAPDRPRRGDAAVSAGGDGADETVPAGGGGPGGNDAAAVQEAFAAAGTGSQPVRAGCRLPAAGKAFRAARRSCRHRAGHPVLRRCRAPLRLLPSPWPATWPTDRHRHRRRSRAGTGQRENLDTPRRKGIMSDLPGSTTLAVGAGQGLGRGQVFGFLRPNGRVTPPRCAPSSVSRRWRAAVRAGTASHRPAGAPPDRPVSGHAGVPGRSVRLWMVAGAAGQLVRSAGIGSAASEQRGLRCGRTGLDVYMVPGGTWWSCVSAGGCA